MMKMNSIIHTYSLPLARPPFRAARCFAGLLRTLANLSAKGLPLGTNQRAAVLLTAPANTVFLSIGRLWITFAASVFCKVPKKWARWITFASA